MFGYHFTGDTLRDGRPIPPIGEWLEHDAEVVPCRSGLHASEQAFDAMTYAPGTMLHYVELDGDLVPHGDPIDKYVGRRRRIIASINATSLLREFARWCAMQVIDKWEAPACVRRYLETGDESLRDAAWAAADAARTAWSASGAAADAAWAAADAARSASGAAADAAWAAADAARDASRAAQRNKLKALVDAAFAQQKTADTVSETKEQ